ncbi:MAG: SDR family NAD(P)-dependent oxidoreductase [Promethearchaeota archaeon]|nr:MAG: SDR family NAD(P)-dependent oxidoreductase [Candidatus Lokiarchaeota archaeon]
MKDFKDKVVVITGGANGIGRGIANIAAKEGMKIVLADIESDALSKAEDELKEAGVEVVSVLTDVTKVDDVKALAQKTIDTFGEVHLLCNNAGVLCPYGYIWDFSLLDLKWIIDVNFWGVIHGIHFFVPIMFKQDNECHIVNTSSLAGLISAAETGIYGVTKHGIVAISEALAKELELKNSKIKVSVLCPSAVNTTILDCERNRPDEYRGPDYMPFMEKMIKKYPESKKKFEEYRRTFEAGLSPNQAGSVVFQAIRDEVFYILTHTDLRYKISIENRMNDIIQAFEQNKLYNQKNTKE